MEDLAVAHGVKLHFIPSFQAAISPAKDLRTFLQLLILFWREKPGVVHTHTFKAGLLGRLAAWITGVPLIIHTYHGHLLSGYWSPLKTNVVRIAESLLTRVTDKIVAVSNQVATDLTAAKIVPRDKIQVIELGFDVANLETQLSRRPKLRSDLGISADDEVVGIVGRLVPVKGVDLFLAALAPLLTSRPHLHLVVIGDGSEANALKASVSGDQSDRIHFCGWRRPVIPDLPDLDICICSSRNEGTSVSIIESVISKVPVISTEVGGMGDLLGHGVWGTLVDPNVDALRGAVDSLLSLLALPASEPRRLEFSQKVTAASDSFKKRFSVERLLREIHTLYESADHQRDLMHADWRGVYT
jgi:glycosyltransferase involved in cell wall biosynthesis